MKIIYRLIFRLAPKIVERDRIIGPVEPPHPIVRFDCIGVRRRKLPYLHDLSQGGVLHFRTLKDLFASYIGTECDRCPSTPRVGCRPRGPWLVPAGQRAFEISSVGQLLICIHHVKRHRSPNLSHIAQACALLRLRFNPCKNRKQDARQDGKDRHHHEQFYESKAVSSHVVKALHFCSIRRSMMTQPSFVFFQVSYRV